MSTTGVKAWVFAVLLVLPGSALAEVTPVKLRNCTVLSRLFGTETGVFNKSREVEAFRQSLQTQLLARYPENQRETPETAIEVTFKAAGFETEAVLGYPALYFQDAAGNGKEYQVALEDLKRTRKGMEAAGTPGGLIQLYRSCVQEMTVIRNAPPAWARKNDAGYFIWPEAFDPLVWE